MQTVALAADRKRWHSHAMAEPMLVFRRTGKTIGRVVAWGFGGGTILLGVTSAAADAFRAAAIWPALRSYSLAALPFFLFGLVLAACRRELWFLPELRVFRMLTFRPWRRDPRVEQASVEEYAGVCRVAAEDGDQQARNVVALVTAEGARIPVRELDDVAAATAFGERLSEATALPYRDGEWAKT